MHTKSLKMFYLLFRNVSDNWRQFFCFCRIHMNDTFFIFALYFLNAFSIFMFVHHFCHCFFDLYRWSKKNEYFLHIVHMVQSVSFVFIARNEQNRISWIDNVKSNIEHIQHHQRASEIIVSDVNLIFAKRTKCAISTTVRVYFFFLTSWAWKWKCIWNERRSLRLAWLQMTLNKST